MIKVDRGAVEMNGVNADLLTEASFAVASAAYAMTDNGKNDVFASASLYAITLAEGFKIRDAIDKNLKIEYLFLTEVKDDQDY